MVLSAANQELALRAGGVEALLATVRENLENASIVEPACSALWELWNGELVK